jgi:RimJ/RimL family protein N-acetyltransferase
LRSIREMKSEEITSVVDYFLNADTEYSIAMGVDKSKLPDRSEWIDSLQHQIEAGERFYVTWLVDNEPIGHSNLADIVFGDSASMHLHIWNVRHRRSEHGLALLRQTLPLYFRRFELRKLICEPCALNPAPGKALDEVGFQFVKRYDAVPGPICFYQPVNRYELARSVVELP